MINEEAKKSLMMKLSAIEDYLGADVISFYGPIIDGTENIFKKIIENLDNKKEIVYIILTTSGGSPRTTERLVNILRNHYAEVNFIVPDYAYSAGTLFCMSGDNIYMNYFSVLGPIDPQVINREGKFVPVLGYLDKIEELLSLARKNQLSQAEFLILKDFDLAELKGYEQARDLATDLLKRWLVKYKFKNWNVTESSKNSVTLEIKQKRAEEIARMLGNYSLWKSHSRPLDINILRKEVNLKIEDFGKNTELNSLITSYYDFFLDYIEKNNFTSLNFFHTRKFI